MRVFNETQVGWELITSILYIINKVELSIYKFSTWDTKKCSNRLFQAQVNWFTNPWTLNI